MFSDKQENSFQSMVTYITPSTHNPRPSTLNPQPLDPQPLDPQPFRITPSTKVENGLI